MGIKRFKREGNQFIVHTDGGVCATKQELLSSEVFEQVYGLYVQGLREHSAPLAAALGIDGGSKDQDDLLLGLLRGLSERPIEGMAKDLPGAERFDGEAEKIALHEFVEGLYDFWRSFDRFIVLHSESGSGGLDQRPYRAFNLSIEQFTHLVRSTYRDICENITGDHPRIYRQVAAGCDMGIIAVPKESKLPDPYRRIAGDVPFMRQMWIDPPMIFDPPMNRRTGQFQKVEDNPVSSLPPLGEEWLCYPARVGPLVIFVYFHQRFIGLGCALSNLFELATDEQIAAGPDAIYLYGVPPDRLAGFGELPTVFHDDEAAGLLVAAVPGEDRFGYFGYLKKMMLTLHNAIMMKRGLMPFHGALVHILMRNGEEGNILIIGDTATGKSETLEAFRVIGDAGIREMVVIADDMGSMEVDEEGRILGYGTEIGAFIRLDDLQQGYAFRQIDRSIIMSPQRVNARVVLPVTTIEEVLRGYPVNYLLYANNYEEVDEAHPILERLDESDGALAVFREGAAVAKGTTTSKGLGHSYFANIFGPQQYRELHDPLAERTFGAALKSGVWVGQLRTRLGVPGYETRGPEEAARALLDLMERNSC